jgi:chromosome segregation ATPase
MNQAKAQATNWENSYNDMKNKVSHMDTLTNQIGEAKRMVVEKNIEVQNLQNQIQDLNNKVNNLNSEIENQKQQVAERDIQIVKLSKLVPSTPAPKKSINTKKKPTSVVEEAVEVKPPELRTTPVAPLVMVDKAVKVNDDSTQEEADDF